MDTLPFHDEDDTSSDDVVEEKQDRKDREKCSSSYKPINQECLWFEHVCPKDKDEQLTNTKFKAHSAFKKKDYHKALSLYEECRELLPSNANLLLREVCESQARCLIKIGRHGDAESILNMLVDEKGNPQDSTLQALLSDVYSATGNLEAAADCLKKCIDLHPDYPSYFLKIADLYMNLQKSEESFQRHHDACCCERTESECVGDKKNNRNNVWYFVDMFLENVKQSLEKKKILVNEKNINVDEMMDCSILKNEEEEKICVNSCDEEKYLSKNQDPTGGSTESKPTSGGKLSSLVENIFKNNGSNDIGTCCHMLQDLSVMKDEMIKKGVRCFCIEHVLKFLNFMNSQDQGDFGQGQLLFSKDRVCDGEDRNGITSNLNTNIENIHRTTWKLLMKLPQIFATVKAWSLLQKSVLYSKGFGRACEEKKLTNVEQKASNLLGSKANVKILAQVLENAQYLEKQASSTDRKVLNSN